MPPAAGGSPDEGPGGASGSGAGGAPGGTDSGGSTAVAGMVGSGGSPPATTDTPCPTNGDPCKILPLGDSITDGIGASGGYRVHLFELAAENGKSITYVGNSMNGPNDVAGMPFPKSHEGHSGWTVQQIADIVPAPALDQEPHIILLHIGTNDMYQMPDGADGRLGSLLDELIDDNPAALLVVSNIIPFPQASGQVSSYNSALGDVVQERIDGGARMLFVDQFEGFPTGELGDGVHPNAAGYARMAEKWWAAIEEYLP
jgi:lysophospholipase L1-like esterase